MSSSGAEKLLHNTEGLDDFGQEFSDFLCTDKSIDCSLNVGSIDLNWGLAHTTEESQCMSEETGHGLVYECVRCSAKVLTEELDLRGGGIKCTFCGYRVLKKIRPPVVKRVSTD